MSAFEDFRLNRSMELLQESEEVDRVTDFCVQYLLTNAPDYIKQDDLGYEEMVELLEKDYNCTVVPIDMLEELKDGCQPA